jgi:ABC-type sugar transport system permease subunit
MAEVVIGYAVVAYIIHGAVMVGLMLGESISSDEKSRRTLRRFVRGWVVAPVFLPALLLYKVWQYGYAPSGLRG